MPSIKKNAHIEENAHLQWQISQAKEFVIKMIIPIYL